MQAFVTELPASAFSP